MEPKEIVEELKAILVARLRFDPRRAAEMSEDTGLPKGVPDSIGLDSLDFIELSIAVEERFGISMEDDADLAAAFASLGSLGRHIAGRLGGG